jgi:replicative DNA helicase
MTLTTNRRQSSTHSEEAEAAVLGAVLLAPDVALDEAIDMLAPADFYQPAHQEIFEAVEGLFNLHKPVDAVTVSDELAKTGMLERIGGIAYITRLLDDVPTASNVRHYASIVRGFAVRRSLDVVAQKIRSDALDLSQEVAMVLDQAEQGVYEIGLEQSGTRVQRLAPLLGVALDKFEEAQTSGSAGLSLGFLDLDRLLTGVAPGNLVLLAARPSVGKSALALSIAHRVAESQGPVAFFSLEMSKQELVQRLLCATGRVDGQRARRGELVESEWGRLTGAAERLHALPLYVEDSAGMTIGQLRARARRIARDAGALDLIVVDYLQLMAGSGDNREQEIASVSRGLKALAQDLEVPVLGLSQLNRSVELRENKRPRLADLRESGSLEQDADIVMFLYRDDYYSPADPSAKGKAELNVAKHRSGGTGSVPLTFQATYAAFEDTAGQSNGP